MANFNVNSMDTLNAALASSDNDINITITGDFSLTSPVQIPAGKNVTITSDSTKHRIIRGTTGDLITLNNQSSLTISNLIIDGYKSAYPDAGGSLITNYSAATLSLQPGTELIGNAYQGDSNHNGMGGAVNLSNSTLTLDHTTISGNEAKDGGGIYTTDTAVTVKDSTFINNKASEDGAGLFVDFSGSTTVISGTDFMNNVARNNGGGLEIGSPVSVKDSTFMKNKARFGGGVYLMGSTSPKASFDSSILSGNTADYGGAIYNVMQSLYNLDVSSTVSFSDNKGVTNTDIIKPEDLATHNAHIKTTKFTSPHKYAYNNDDIFYYYNTSNNYTLGDGTNNDGAIDNNNKLKKTLSDGSALSDKQFQFGLFDDNGNQVAAGTNDSSGNITFSKVLFDEIATHHYTVKELPDPTGKYSTDKTVYPVTISVIYNGGDNNRPLMVRLSWEGGKTPVFVNSPPSINVTIQASKQIKSNSTTTDTGSFKFDLIESGKVLSTVTSNPDGTIIFPEIDYTDIGEHDYQIAEVVDNPPKPGWQYDQHYCSVHVSVTKDANGKLVAKVTYNPVLNPNFVNIYTAQDAPVRIQNKVIPHGKELAGGEFEFDILDKNGNIVGKTHNDKDGNIIFPDVNLPAGDYEFKVIPPKTGGGWTFDKPEVPVHVGVKDNGDGTSRPVVTYPDDPNFNAYYNPTAAKFHITAHKVIDGWTLPQKSDKKFTFVLRNSKGEEMRIQGTDGTIDFGEFEARENLTVTVFEEGTDSDGWTLDRNVHTINVTVTDDGKGQLYASIDHEPTFLNTYKPAQATTGEDGTPKVKKAVSGGKPLEAGQFTFGVFDDKGNLVTTGSNDSNGDIKFPVGYFDKPGEIDYTIRETTPDGGGYTTDKSSYPYKVIVTDNGKGQLVAEIIEPSPEPTFINTYNAEGSEHILAYKSLQGWNNGQASPTFKFTLKDKEGNVVKEIESPAGTLDFGVLSYTEPGDYEYTVNEEMPLPDGWTIPTSSYRVVVHMTDDGKGGLIASVSYPDSNDTAPQFVNTYSTLPVNVGRIISGTPTKTLSGKTLKDSEFRFGLYDGGGNLIAVGFNNADGTIRFPLFYSSKLGETDYEMKEISADGKGITTDKTSYPVKVNITDNGEGKLSADVTYPNGTPAFKNVYTSENAPANIKGAVIGHGKDPADGEFEFDVLDEQGNVVGKAHNDDNGNIVFPSLSLPDGEYDYKIVAPKDGNGWTFDVPELPVHISVTDDGDGTSSSKTSYPDGNIFNASYSTTPANVGDIINNNPSGEFPTKTISGGGPADNHFSFGLYDESGNLVAMGINYADGKIHFPVFTSSKIGNTSYTLKEVTAPGNGYITDTTIYPVNVNITDNGDGTLSAEVTYPGGVPAFHNIYNSKPVSERITAQKIIHGWDNTEKQFNFLLKDSEGNVIKTAQNKDGLIDFGVTDFTEPGTYCYTIEEDGTSAGAGWFTDPTVFNVVVTVTRDENQNLVASVDYPGGNVPIFDNYYVTKESPIEVGAKKTAVGKDLEDGQFEFELNNSDGTIILYAKNDGSGNISFSEFDLPEGEYDFTMHETSPDKDNWITDKNKIPVHISVIDNGDGTTKAEISYPEGAVFTNIYNSKPAKAIIRAKKCVCGAGLCEGMFKFGVFKKNGEQIAQIRNDRCGCVTFPELQFDKPGVYLFTLKELNESCNGWECDKKVVDVTVTVTADEKGTLSADVTYDTGTVPIFTNRYYRC
jgi:pilin isopeptide linkage protein